MCYYTKLQHRDAFEHLIAPHIIKSTREIFVILGDDDDDDNNDDKDAVTVFREEIIR